MLLPHTQISFTFGENKDVAHLLLYKLKCSTHTEVIPFSEEQLMYIERSF